MWSGLCKCRLRKVQSQINALIFLWEHIIVKEVLKCKNLDIFMSSLYKCAIQAFAVILHFEHQLRNVVYCV